MLPASLGHLRVGTRTAAAILLYSFGARQGEDRGVLESDVVQSLVGPEVDRATVTTCLHDLRDELLYLHYTGRRYRFEPRPNLNLLIAEEERRIDIAEVQARVRSRIEGDLAQSGARALLWPADSAAIPDHVPAFQVVYLGLDAAEVDAAAASRLVESLLEGHGAGHREYRNALAFAIPGRGVAGDARKAARAVLAIEEILRQVKDGRLKIEPEQREQLAERGRGAQATFAGAIERLHETVLVPVADREGERPYRLEPIDVRSIPTLSSSIQGRVLEGLRTYVFDSLTPARLIAKAGLGPDRPFVACSDLVKWFFSYFDFPKLRGEGALKRAIAAGAADVLGYVAAGRLEDGELVAPRPDLVQIGATLPEGEIDLGDGCFIVTPELAHRLAGRDRPALGADEPSGGGSADIPTGNDVPPVAAGAAGTQTALGGTRYRLRASMDAGQFFRIVPAIVNLSDKAASFRATLDVEIETQEPLTLSWLRNAVDEHFDEAGVRPETELR
jgi:hypothetical protein